MVIRKHLAPGDARGGRVSGHVLHVWKASYTSERLNINEDNWTHRIK